MIAMIILCLLLNVTFLLIPINFKRVCGHIICEFCFSNGNEIKRFSLKNIHHFIDTSSEMEEIISLLPKSVLCH